MSSPLAEKVLLWFKYNARKLPWRNSTDPYVIWVSEIMLQQTRVETVIPYFHRWIERFPTIEHLANASEHDVLMVWEGLGYYARARNLHQAACKVLTDYGGCLPRTVQELITLPGIGRYTAGAIVSIAFGADEETLDGNIRRVLSRFFQITEPEKSYSANQRLWRLAKENIPAGFAGEYNQALMELGAMICTPRSPKCEECPINDDCLAKRLGIQDKLPVKSNKKPLPHLLVTSAVIHLKDLLLIAQRKSDGLLGNLWEFPGGKQQDGEDLTSCLKREILKELGVVIDVGELIGTYKHAYTHFRITSHAFCCKMAYEQKPTALQVNDFKWVRKDQLNQFPMGKVDRIIARQIQRGEQCLS
jgi:A/G-specific adenine glycosylase